MNPEVERALIFAARAHQGQLRKGLLEAYINHPAKVMEDAIAAGLPVDAQVAATLHDVVEDTDVTHEDLEREGFSKRSRLLVRLLTKWWSKETPPDVVAIYKPAYYTAIRTDRDAIALKLLDRTDNLRGALRILGSHVDWVQRYHTKTVVEFGALTVENQNRYADAAYFEALRALGMALAQH